VPLWHAPRTLPGSGPSAEASRSFQPITIRDGVLAGMNPEHGFRLRKKIAFQVFISAVVVFDAVGCHAFHLPTLQFLPMWVGAMMEIEVEARALAFLGRRFHSCRPLGPRLPA